ncbi:hypothetical protein ISN44_As08g033050 [Arabidopsis suecica]|uniref:KIB1-4 beta-propeller domain-containing protein n=1 Tax=Arabidopsis suecica TaxID=45249 RepID=A0A8T2BCJ6_ARASU|nr:hypothetical protein ISN44_As08g033050 [Arabidopsis suecica]
MMIESGSDQPPPFRELVRRTHTRKDDFNPSETVSASLQHNLDMDMGISGLEKNSETVNINVETLKADITTLKDYIVALKSMFKDEIAATRASLQVILHALGVNSATPQQVNHTQPYVPTAMSHNPTVLNATMPNTASTPPMTQAQRAAFEECSKQTVPQQNRSPWLMLFPDGDYGCVLYNPDEDRIYKSVRDFSETIFLANSGNWFLVMDSKSNLYIIDVFSENRIDLPPLESFQSDYFTLERLGDKKFKLQVTDHHCEVLRGLLWVDKKTKEFVVVWFFDYNCKFLAYCKKGGDHYSYIEICYFLPEYRGVSDMVLHGYFLYIATPRGYIRFLDLSKQEGFEEVTQIYPLKWFNPIYYKTNCSIVVTTAGEVLMFQNNLDKKNFESDKSFRLYKHGPNEINYYDPPLVEVDSLGDEEALLLDLGITMPVIEPNSIYFIRQDRVLHRQDINLHICVFNLETKTLKRLPRLSNMNLMDARWFLPGI